jgi:hypothetical protein
MRDISSADPQVIALSMGLRLHPVPEGIRRRTTTEVLFYVWSNDQTVRDGRVRRALTRALKLRKN